MKLNHYLLMLCMSLLLFSCKNENEPQGELITVKLTPAFISLNQEPDVPMHMKGSNVKMVVNAEQVIYAIQVYENDVEYYYGLFDTVDSMKIALTTGKTYRFKVATYKTGTGNGLKQDALADGKYFYLPNKTLLGNKFIKGNVLKDINLIASAKLTTTTVKDYPEIDAFYCDKSVTVEKGLSNINFDLLRMGFGVTYNVDGLTNGKFYISMGNDTTVLTSTTNTDTSVRLFNVSNGDLTTIFNTANMYADSILIKVQWVGTNGTTLNTQGKFKFSRNFQKTINIQLNTTGTSLNFEDWNTVTDVDGNVYHTVTIGSQTWMIENLKVTHYRDGTAIPNVTSATTWTGLSTGAYCDYNNTPSNSNTYGKLYNWFAVSDSRKLAPVGWHVPTNPEWTTLLNYLGGVSLAGGKLKEIGTARWLSPNTGATDSYGFKALPSGNRKYDAVFDYIGFTADFWTSTEATTANAWYIRLYSTSTNVDAFSYGKLDGFAVRCIKD